MKFFLVHKLKTLGIPWRKEEMKRGRRKGGEREGQEKKRGQLWGMNRHIAVLVHILVRKLYLVKICAELMYFIIAIKDPFFHLFISYPHLVERIRSPFYSVAFTGLQLPKEIIYKTITWCLDQGYNCTFWKGNEVGEDLILETGKQTFIRPGTLVCILAISKVAAYRNRHRR